MTRGIHVHLTSPGWITRDAYCELGFAFMYIYPKVRNIEFADSDGYVLECDPGVGPLLEDLKRLTKYLEIYTELDPDDLDEGIHL
jgi:hypothetical protein